MTAAPSRRGPLEWAQTRPVRVTAAMMVEAERKSADRQMANPYRRIREPSTTERAKWEAEHQGRPMEPTMIVEDIATEVMIRAWGEVRFEQWRTTIRRGTPAELAQLCNDSQSLRTALAATVPREDIGQVLGNVAASMLAAEATAVCGAPAGPNNRPDPRPCNDSEERACAWFMHGRAPGQDLGARDRTSRRPPTCPRRIELEALIRAESPRRRAEAESRGIPPDVLNVLVEPGKQQQRPALLQVRHWFRGNKPILVLSGPERCGKTFAACAWLLSAKTGLRVAGTDLLLAAVPKSTHEVVRRASSLAAVVVDGLDDELTPGSLAVLARLLQSVTKHGRAVITTRHRKRELLDLLTASSGPAPIDDLPDFEQHPQQRGGAADQGSAIEQRLALYAHFVELPAWAGE